MKGFGKRLREATLLHAPEMRHEVRRISLEIDEIVGDPRDDHSHKLTEWIRRNRNYLDLRQMNELNGIAAALKAYAPGAKEQP